MRCRKACVPPRPETLVVLNSRKTLHEISVCGMEAKKDLVVLEVLQD